MIVDAADALVESILRILIIKALLSRQDGLDGAVLVDHLLLEKFGRAQMFQPSGAVPGIFTFACKIKQA